MLLLLSVYNECKIRSEFNNFQNCFLLLTNMGFRDFTHGFFSSGNDAPILPNAYDENTMIIINSASCNEYDHANFQ